MRYKVIVYVPTSHADLVRDAMGKAGGGRIGNYSGCSFSMKGVGRFLPGKGANPSIGQVGKPEAVEEECIEMSCDDSVVDAVIAKMKSVHPYEEVAYDVFPLADR